MTTVAELFVNIGVKGADKSLASLKGVKGALKEVSSTSLEAKAAIVAAVYALQRLFDASGKRGTELSNYNAQLGLSTKTLQEYSYAARQAGASNEEMMQSFTTISKEMTNIRMGKSGPAGMQQLSQWYAQFVNGVGFGREDIEKFRQKPEEFIKAMQQIAQSGKVDKKVFSAALDFLPGNVIAAINKNAFTPENLAKAPTYSDKEVDKLQKAQAAWGNFFEKFEMMIGRINAKYGEKVVNGLGKVADSVGKVIEASVKFSDKVSLVDGITKSLDIFAQGIANFGDMLNKMITSAWFKYLMNTSGDKIISDLKFAADPKGSGKTVSPGNVAKNYVNSLTEDGEDRQRFLDFTLNFLQNLFEVMGTKKNDISKVPSQRQDEKNTTAPVPGSQQKEGAPATFPNGVPSGANPAPNAPPVVNHAKNQQVEFNQTFNFQNDGKDANVVANAVRQANQTAFRTFTTQVV